MPTALSPAICQITAFSTDSKLDVKEGIVLDTLAYKLTSDNTISIVSFGITLNGVDPLSDITDLTTHTAMITSPTELTPGGELKRNVSLIR